MPPSFLAVRLNAETYPVEPEERAELERAEAEFVSLEGETEAEICLLYTYPSPRDS